MSASEVINHRFEIGPLLGEGGMGQVFRGRDRLTGDAVAIKRLKAELAARQPELIERFEREGEALRRLNHPNIVKVLAIPRVQGALHIVMELVEGGSLADLLGAEPRLPIARVVAIALELADALSRAHHLKIVHRDLKPGNVLLTREQTPRLTDFGIARFADSTFTATGAIVGTYGYMSPEVLNGSPAGPEADVWSLGVLLYEMLAGRRPFAALQPGVEVASILNRRPEALEQLRPEAPAALVSLTNRMLEKTPASRISSMRLVGSELESIQLALERGASISGISTAARLPSSPLVDPSGLPLQPTAFVGREESLEELSKRLEAPDARVVTILGAGGMGKTRLAIELARRQRHCFADGVFFVPLASVTGALVVAAIAESCGYRFSGPDAPRIQLLNFLRGKRLLLVLDNFDHLLETAPLLSEIVDQAPGTRMLVTSRERLSLRCENVFHVEGLDIPNDSRPAQLRSCSAVQLFLQSTRGVGLDSVPDEEELDTIVAICRAVFGMPLAIELAAGWLEALSPREILAELQRGVDFLESDLRDIPERHRSLRVVFESSWAQLDATERRAMARLSIFPGSFTREAAQAVGDVSLRTLARLVNKSLLKRNASGRYEQHGLIRQHAMTKLASQDEASAREAHARHYARRVQEQEGSFHGAGQLEALRAVEIEIDNIRAAWTWALETRQWAVLSQLLEGGYRFHDMRGLFQLGEALFRHAADEVSVGVRAGDEVLRARLLSRQGRFLFQLGEFAQARTLLETSLAVLRGADSKGEIAYCLYNLADVASTSGDFESSETLAHEGLEISKCLGDRTGMGTALNNLGVVFYNRQDFGEAERLFRESLELFRTSGDRWGVGFALNNLGVLAHDLHRYEQAEECYRESFALCEEVGDAHGVTAALINLGRVHCESGDLETAHRLSLRGLEQAQRLGEPWSTAAGLLNLGEIARARGDCGEAARLFVLGIRRAHEIQATTLTLEGLVGLAEVAARLGNSRQAFTVATAVVDHPAADAESREKARRLQGALQGVMGESFGETLSPPLDELVAGIVTGYESGP